MFMVPARRCQDFFQLHDKPHTSIYLVQYTGPIRDNEARPEVKYRLCGGDPENWMTSMHLSGNILKLC